MVSCKPGPAAGTHVGLPLIPISFLWSQTKSNHISRVLIHAYFPFYPFTEIRLCGLCRSLSIQGKVPASWMLAVWQPLVIRSERRAQTKTHKNIPNMHSGYYYSACSQSSGWCVQMSGWWLGWPHDSWSRLMNSKYARCTVRAGCNVSQAEGNLRPHPHGNAK